MVTGFANQTPEMIIHLLHVHITLSTYRIMLTPRSHFDRQAHQALFPD